MGWLRCLLFFVLLALSISACAGEEQIETRTGTIHLEQRVARNGGAYIHGAAWFVSATAALAAGEVVPFRATVLHQKDLSIELYPRLYTILSAQRACIANCSRLGPLVDGCRKAIRVRAGREVRAVVEIRPGGQCTIVLE